jgi:hypothetical protein
MGHIGSHDDPAAARVHADKLHARRMAADRMQADTRCELDWPVVEPHSSREVQPYEADDILDFESPCEVLVPHVAAGRVVQLGFLQMKLRRREALEGAGVVVVQMGQDNILYRAGINSDQRQRRRRTAQMPTSTRCRHFRGKAGIDDKGAVRRSRYPDEIVHWHRAIVRITADEVIGASGIALGVADRVELVFRRRVSMATSDGKMIATAQPQCEPMGVAYSRRKEIEP